MGFFKNLFSTETVVEKAANGVYNGLDALVHTGEEKEQDYQSRLNIYLKFLELTKGSSPARRMIAKFIMVMWFVVGMDLIILYNVAIFIDLFIDTAVIDLYEGIGMLQVFAIDYVAKPTALVLAFYYGAHVLGKLKT